MKTHEIKVWPSFYSDLVTYKKRFELRLNDRDYREGDLVTLKEWDNITKKYTGASFQVKIDYVLCDTMFGLKAGYCIFTWE